MSAIIASNNYGKSRVRILIVKRNNPVHEIVEMNVAIQLEGDFETVHTKGDNIKVLPTDTMKNTVYALAKDHDVNSIEEFAIHLAKYLKENNKQVTAVRVEIEEKLWNRIMVKDKNGMMPHDHSFISGGDEKRTCRVIQNGTELTVHSGLKDLLVLKTTNSGFENYIKDKYTTLKETSDRVFSTSVKAVWKYANQEVSYVKSFQEIRQIILETFAAHHSLSVQQTLYETGKNVIEKINDVNEI